MWQAGVSVEELVETRLGGVSWVEQVGLMSTMRAGSSAGWWRGKPGVDCDTDHITSGQIM